MLECRMYDLVALSVGEEDPVVQEDPIVQEDPVAKEDHTLDPSLPGNRKRKGKGMKGATLPLVEPQQRRRGLPNCGEEMSSLHIFMRTN